jgi:hypothetical protein
MAIGARHRDQSVEISRKHGNTLIRTLRKTYGPGFAKYCADDEKLSDVLSKLDKLSLFRLVRDYEAGMLPIRLKGSPGSDIPGLFKVPARRGRIG